MQDEIICCRRLAYRHLSLRLDLVERTDLHGVKDSKDFDGDIAAPLMKGLQDCDTLDDIKIMGVLLNPLFQCGPRMVEAGLCTKEQIRAGKRELLDRLKDFYERTSEACVDSTPLLASNRWDEHNISRDCESPEQLANKELEKYVSWNHSQYLPTMEATKLLGAIDADGNPREPVYAFGAVIERGSELPCEDFNHADYVDSTGYYNIVQYLINVRNHFPAIYSVGVGQLAAHSPTEVNCEGCFSLSGYLNHPSRSSTGIRLYEWIVIGHHRMKYIHVSRAAVHKLYMDRHSDKNWDEEEERDTNEFLEIEKSIFSQMFPGVDGDKEKSGGCKEAFV